MKAKGWLQLIIAISLVLGFMLYLGPWMERLPYFQSIAKYIEENDINTNVYFYTEVEEFSEAEVNLQNTMDYIVKKFK